MNKSEGAYFVQSVQWLMLFRSIIFLQKVVAYAASCLDRL